ncbi:hypothetical protein HN51_048515 [Arachis hypogaea]|uniref:U1-type domain-containing protein n=1 Tax=Arachis hypogaea TaxID=3818 RepID=A0A445ALD5_ARAHY|nr:zinc finger RNA-binding protein [Arachis hypogaea]QHO25062.1 uncharacterized protein DS421_12g377840 [Arachis hypogaea]RYR27243.1 hypothetical protein Ahy_B02g061591 [Arachis hypogaea]
MNYSAYNERPPYYPYSNRFNYIRDPHGTYLPIRHPGVYLTEPEPLPPRLIHRPVGPPQYSHRPYGVHGGGPFNTFWRHGPDGGRHFTSYSSGPAISDAAGLHAAARATSVSRSSSSVLAPAPSAQRARNPYGTAAAEASSVVPSAQRARRPYGTAAAEASSVVLSSSSVLASAPSAKQARKPYGAAAAEASFVEQSSCSVITSAPSAKRAQEPDGTAAAGASSVVRPSSSVLVSAPSAKRAREPDGTAAAGASSVVRSSSSVLESAPSAKRAREPDGTAAAGASSVVGSSSSVLASAPSTKQAREPDGTAGASSVVRSSSSITSAPSAKQTQKPAAPSQPPPKAWCEICKIWCHTLGVLEEHKQGRRHMNKVKRQERLEEQKAISELQNKQTATTKSNLTDQAKKVQEPEKVECPTGNTGSEVASVNHKVETMVQNDARDTLAAPAEEPEAKKTSWNIIPVQHHVLKPKKKRKASKLVKITAALRRPVQNQISEQFIPFDCKLCNVRLESEIAFGSHVNGKEHISRLIHAPGRQALSGMFGLQVLYPPDIDSLSKAINVQVQHGDNNPQLLLAKHLMDSLSQSKVAATAPPMN